MFMVYLLRPFRATSALWFMGSWQVIGPMICSPQGPIQHRIQEMGWVAVYPDTEDDYQMALQWEVMPSVMVVIVNYAMEAVDCH